jgi:signal transduction histidine kinase
VLLQGAQTDQQTVARMRKAINAGEGISIEILNYTKDQRPYWIASDIQPIRNEKGELLKFIAIQRDITERKKIEETLSSQNEELKKANQELDNFVYRVSHDLRAPLATMGELLEVMKEEFKGNDDVLSYVGMQEQSLQKQDNFIRDILDYSRNARLPIKKVPVDIAQEAVNMYATLPRLGEHAKPLLTIEAGQLDWQSDIARFRVILQNLLTNAVRYADYTKAAQWIKVVAFIDGDALTMTVEDNGIGIKKQHLPKVFDMFYRATAKHTGSGLGLYIAKEALDRLSGTISVESEFGQGTKFMMRIP